MSEVRKIQIQDGKGNVYHPQTVSEQVLGLNKRLEGLAKETYVDEKIAAIPEVDLSDIENNILTLEENKADKTELESLKETVDKKADKTDVTSQLSLKADKSELNNKADKTELTPINKEIDNLKSSGVESNRIMVEALNSKGVQASIDNSIIENASKINDITVGDYSIGDICKKAEAVYGSKEVLLDPYKLLGLLPVGTGEVMTIVKERGSPYMSSEYYVSAKDSGIKTLMSKGKVASMNLEPAEFKGHSFLLRPKEVGVIGATGSRIIGFTPKLFSFTTEWTADSHNADIVDMTQDEKMNVYTVDTKGEICATTPAGKHLWTGQSDPGKKTTICTNDKVVVTLNTSGAMHVFSMKGDLQYKLELGGETGRPLYIDSDSNMYYTRHQSGASAPGGIKKVDPTGQKTIWTHTFDQKEWFHDVDSSDDSNLYWLGYTGFIEHTDTHGRGQTLSFPLDSTRVGKILINENLALIGTENGAVISAQVTGPETSGYKILK